MTVTPGINGSPGAYTDDEIAVWIDYNNDFDFDDAGEQVGYVLVDNSWTTGTSNVFQFYSPNFCCYWKCFHENKNFLSTRWSN